MKAGGRPRKYKEGYTERFPFIQRISEDSHGRAKFYKIILKASNDEELFVMALDALQEKLSRQFPDMNIANMASYTFTSSNKPGDKTEIFRPASVEPEKII